MGMAGASNSRGKPYAALMLLVAFGAALLLGVMLLNKFRESRVCNLLLKRTDQDLHSYQHLYQRERDGSKELVKNSEDMKALVYLLRTQKMELDRRLLELQSTIYSLREKQKILNVALHERQSEIKMLRNQNSQLVDLRRSLRQKEGELEDLKRRLESRGAVAADDPSDPREDNRGEAKSTDFSQGSDETETRKAEEALERRQKQEESGRQEVEGGDVRKENGEESELANEHEEEKSKVGEHQRADKILQSRVRMETETGKYERTRKTRGKRWRYIAKNRAVDNGWRLISKKVKQENNRNLDDKVISTTHRKFVREDNTEKEARKNLTDKESKILKHEELNSKNIDTSSEDVNGGVDGSIKQTPGEEMELTDSKSEEKQVPEREDSGFNRETDSEVVEDAEEGNKEETEESEF